MARIRSIKPSFFRSEDVSVLPLRARLTWIGLWTHCDDAGRTKDNVRLIKGDVWPLDEVSLRDIEEDLETLAAHGRIVRYEVDGRRYLEIANWSVHQSIQKATPSRIPGPDAGMVIDYRTATGAPPEQVDSNGRRMPVDNPSNGTSSQVSGPARDSGSPTVVLPENGGTPTSRRGKEGRGREGTRAAARDGPPPAEPPSLEPPSKCPEHLDDPKPPACGPCKDARLAHDRWRAERDRRHDQAPKCPQHVGELAANCRVCASVRKGGPEDP